MLQRRRRGRFHASKPSYLRHPKSYKVLCSGCGKEVVTPVPPPNDKALTVYGVLQEIEISEEQLHE